MARTRGKKALVAGLIFVVGLEAALQVAHLVAVWLRPSLTLPHPGSPVILCLGDSHTYGVKVAETESYPSQLQSLLDREQIPANVINLGQPGQNTSELRRTLPALLLQYQPAVVVIQVGANNDWNRSEVAWSDWQDGLLSGWSALMVRAWYGVIGSLRTVRLATYVWNETGRRLHPLERVEDRQGRVYFHEWRGKGEWGTLFQTMNRTRRDLTAIVDLVRARGAEPVLMTYVGQPFSPMTALNQCLRDVAQARGVILVDNDTLIQPRFMKPDGTMDQAAHDRLFLTDPGETHLAGPGYALVALHLFSTLKQHRLLEKK